MQCHPSPNKVEVSKGIAPNAVDEGTATPKILLGAIVASTLLVSFYCSICEAALFSISDGRVEQLAQNGTAGGKRLKRLRKHIERPIAAILSLNTIAHTVGATLAGSVATSIYDSVGVGIFSGLFTLGILYVSEIIPKTLGVLYAGTLAPFLARSIDWAVLLLWPLVWMCQRVTKLIPRSADTSAASEADLLALAQQGMRAGSIRADEVRWMQNALLLDQVKVSEILTPRTVVFSLPEDTVVGGTVGEGTDIEGTDIEGPAPVAATWPYSRVPITAAGGLDHVTGYVLQRDVFEAVAANEPEKTLADIKREPTFVPETMSVASLLDKFLRERRHLFFVADEYGGTAGIVTLEDALESLLGAEIVDEYDRHTDLQHVARHHASKKLKALRHPKPPDSGDTA